MELTDRQLLIRFAIARDERAFVTLVRRYERLVRAVCRRVLRDEHLAEDAFQAVFLVLAAQARGLCDKHDSLAPWLQTVATNAALQLRRSRLRSQRREQTERPRTEDSVINELLGMLDEELQRLENGSRQAIVLCYLQGMTQDDAAAAMGVSKSTLRRRIEHGMTALRSQFRRRGLLVPLFAVLWKALASQQVEAALSTIVNDLSDAAREMLSPAPRFFPDARVSLTSRNLSQRILVMSRWKQRRWWSAAGLSACALIGLGIFPAMSPSEVAAKPPKPVAQTKQAAKSNAVFVAQDSPGDSNEVVSESPKKPARKRKTNPRVAPNPNPATVSTATSTEVGGSAAGSGGGSGFARVTVLKGDAEHSIDTAEFHRSVHANNQLPHQGAMTSTGTQSFQGVMNVNGKEFRTNDPAEFHRLMQGNRLQPAFVTKNFPGTESFQGTININGREQKFDNPTEFEKAKAGMNLPFPTMK